MNRPIDLRNGWGKYGLWATMLVALEYWWLGKFGCTLRGYLAPVSILASLITVIHLLTDPTKAARYWRPYVVKWLSWWIANYVANLIALCMLFVVFYAWRVMFDAGILFVVALVVPTIRLVQHILWDIIELRCLRSIPVARPPYRPSFEG